MNDDNQSCPLSQSELLDLYFMDHRNNLLEIAAFLDRLDRANDKDGADDFRLKAFRHALETLLGEDPGRVEAIQMMLSDPRSDFLEERDKQSADGVSPHASGVESSPSSEAPS
jgi:hypothetical protein